jgi:hypothetical protein
VVGGDQDRPLAHQLHGWHRLEHGVRGVFRQRALGQDDLAANLLRLLPLQRLVRTLLLKLELQRLRVGVGVGHCRQQNITYRATLGRCAQMLGNALQLQHDRCNQRFRQWL